MPRPRNILITTTGDEAYERLETFLSRQTMEISRASTARRSMFLAAHVRFDLVILQIPLPDASAAMVLSTLRGERSRSREAPVLLLASGGNVEPLDVFRDGGVIIVGLDEPRERLHRAMASALGVAIRAGARLPMVVRVAVREQSEILSCETRNISRSGVLLSSERLLPVGTVFDWNFRLPDEEERLTGRARVVRHADPEQEGVVGMGAAFVHLPRDKEAALDGFVRARVAAGAGA